MEKKKISNVVIVYDYAFINGGAAKVAIKSAIGLCGKVNVVFFSAVAPVCDELINSDVEVKCLGMEDINSKKRLKAMKQGIWNSTSKNEFSRFLDQYDSRDTIIHFHGWCKALSSSIISVAERKNFSCIITLHDYFSVCPNGGFFNYKRNEICTIKPMSLKCILCKCDKRNYFQKMWRVSRQIVQDKFVKKYSRMNYINISTLNKCIVEPFVKSNNFYELKNPIDLSNDYVHISKDVLNKQFLYVGRISNEKGVDLFCKAIYELQNKYSDVEGVVVGDGPLMEQLKKEYTKIKFEGWKNSEEVKMYYKNSRMLIFPSRCYEGAPLTIVEAISAGLPCIVSDCTSAVELVENGKNGYIFKSEDAEDLMAKLELSLDDNNVKSMKQWIEMDFDLKKYSRDAHIDNLLKIYEDCLKQ